jgi:RNA polymerase sigma factor (sigma-70 family)
VKNSASTGASTSIFTAILVGGALSYPKFKEMEELAQLRMRCDYGPSTSPSAPGAPFVIRCWFSAIETAASAETHRVRVQTFPAHPDMDGLKARCSDSGRRLRLRERESERSRRFDALFASYSPDIVAYCRWRAGSSSDAQDAAAEVFLTAWRRLDELPEGDAARVWLYATARRVIANQGRSRRRRLALQERLALEATPVAADPSSADGEAALVHEALRRLGPRDREVLLLAEWEGLSPGQIAAVLGCLTVTARGRLHRARRRFRAVFEDLLARDGREQPTRDASELSTTSLYSVQGGS